MTESERIVEVTTQVAAVEAEGRIEVSEQLHVAEEVLHARHEWSVIVNGRPRTVHHDELTFEQVVHLAFEKPPTGPNVVITVTYARAAGPRPDGTLTKGQRVQITDGTVFNVRATDKS